MDPDQLASLEAATCSQYNESYTLLEPIASNCTKCINLIMLLAHLSRRLMGELIVYQSLRRPSVRPSVVRPSVNIFKHLLL